MSAVHDEIRIRAANLEPVRKLCLLKPVLKGFSANIYALKTECINGSRNGFGIGLLKDPGQRKLGADLLFCERIILFRRINVRTVMLKSIIRDNAADFSNAMTITAAVAGGFFLFELFRYVHKVSGLLPQEAYIPKENELIKLEDLREQ